MNKSLCLPHKNQLGHKIIDHHTTTSRQSTTLNDLYSLNNIPIKATNHPLSFLSSSTKQAVRFKYAMYSSQQWWWWWLDAVSDDVIRISYKTSAHQLEPTPQPPSTCCELHKWAAVFSSSSTSAPSEKAFAEKTHLKMTHILIKRGEVVLGPLRRTSQV